MCFRCSDEYDAVCSPSKAKIDKHCGLCSGRTQNTGAMSHCMKLRRLEWRFASQEFLRPREKERAQKIENRACRCLATAAITQDTFGSFMVGNPRTVEQMCKNWSKEDQQATWHSSFIQKKPTAENTQLNSRINPFNDDAKMLCLCERDVFKGLMVAAVNGAFKPQK